MIAFLAGAFFGTVLGATALALCIASKERDD